MNKKHLTGLLLAACLFALLSAPAPGAEQQKPDQAQQYIDALKKVAADGTYDEYQKQITGLLATGNYTALDDYFTALQKAYEDGKIDDVLLYFAYSPLIYSEDPWSAPVPHPEYDALFTAWKAASPGSYTAHYLAACYHIGIGWSLRANRFPGVEGKEDVQASAMVFKKAAEENEESYKLTKKPILSYANTLELEKNEAGAGMLTADMLKTAQDTLDKADALDPANLMVRRSYMSLLSPRWFGSNPQMMAFVEQSRKSGTAKKITDFLEGMMYADIALTYYGQKNFNGAIMYAQRAAVKEADYMNYDFGQDGLKLFIHATYDRSESKGTSLNDQSYLNALELLLKKGSNTRNPGWYYGQRAKIRWDILHEIPDAWSDYQKGLHYNDPYSAYSVAQALCVGAPALKIAADSAKCREAMMHASDLGSPMAAAYLNYVDSTRTRPAADH